MRLGDATISDREMSHTMHYWIDDGMVQMRSCLRTAVNFEGLSALRKPVVVIVAMILDMVRIWRMRMVAETMREIAVMCGPQLSGCIATSSNSP